MTKSLEYHATECDHARDLASVHEQLRVLALRQLDTTEPGSVSCREWRRIAAEAKNNAKHYSRIAEEEAKAEGRILDEMAQASEGV